MTNSSKEERKQYPPTKSIRSKVIEPYANLDMGTAVASTFGPISFSISICKKHLFLKHFHKGWWIFKREYASCEKCGYIARVTKI
jgi:hypothetical protein